MDCIEGAKRVTGKWLARAMDYLRADSKDLPVRRGGYQVSPAIRGFGL